MKLGGKGTGWLSEKNTLKFFSGYCELSELWRSEAPDRSTLKALYDAVDSFKYPSRSKALLKYKVLQEAESTGVDSTMSEYFTFVERLRANGFWLEKSFSEQQTYASNSFLAAQGIHFRKQGQETLIRKIAEPAAVERARSSLATIFQRIRSLGSQGSAFDRLLEQLAGQSSDLFFALSNIHYEVTENIDHWMYYPANKRCDSDNRSLFGDTLLLEVKLKALVNSNLEGETSADIRRHFSKYPTEFGEYLKAHVAREHLLRNTQGLEARKSFYFVELNYLDNGRGVERNIRNFAPAAPAEFTLHDVISQKISSRKVEGAGLGFNRMLKETRSTNSLFYIRSGDQALSASGHGEQRLQLRVTDEYLFGTIISVLVPVNSRLQ